MGALRWVRLAGSMARWRARLMALASSRWCFEQTPDFRLDSILVWSEMYLMSMSTSL